MAGFSLFHRSNEDPAESNANSIILPIILCFVFGGVLIFLENKALEICSYVLASLLVILGGYQVYVFITSPMQKKMTEPRLAFGVVFLLSGAMLFFNAETLDRIFPFIWGLSLIFGGFMKAQYAFAQYSMKIKRWWIMLVFSAFSLLIGVLALTRPSFLGEHMEQTIGIMMVAEAVLDLVVFFLMNHAMKKNAPDSRDAASPQDDTPHADTPHEDPPQNDPPHQDAVHSDPLHDNPPPVPASDN